MTRALRLGIRYFLIALVVLFAGFYLSLVIPNDRRVRLSPPAGPSSIARTPAFDCTTRLPEAAVAGTVPLPVAELARVYPYIEAHPTQHTGPLNLHVSLGWFPMKTLHRDCIYAPMPGSLTYTVTLPRAPVLRFDHGIISSLDDGTISGGALFTVTLNDGSGDYEVFSATDMPLPRFRWRSFDTFYKQVYKYLRPGLQEREGRWLNSSVDLERFAGKKVTLRFGTRPVGAERAFAFWGQPIVFGEPVGPAKKNVLLIVIDSLRADALNAALAPRMARFAGKSDIFTRCYSNGNMTKLSVPSFLSSRYPLDIAEVTRHYEMNPQDKDFFYRRRLTTLPLAMKAQGYRTAAIGSVSLFSDGYGLSADLGFDEAENLEHSGYSPVHVTQEGMSWLSRHGDEPFFLMLYYDGPHGPYRPPLRYLWRSLRAGPRADNWQRIPYNGEVMYHDEYVGRLFDWLEQTGLMKNTVVLITSDHGVAFRSQTYDWPTRYGSWKKKTVRFHSHGVSVTPEDVNVPLVVHNGGAARTVTEKVQLLDLAPTITDLAAGTVPPDFRGRSLRPALEGKPIEETVTFHQGWLCAGVYWKNDWLYVRNNAARDGFPKETLVPEELFDLTADPACRRNIFSSEPARLTRMRQVMAALAPRPVRWQIVVTTGTAEVTLESAGLVRCSGKTGGRITVALTAGEMLPFTVEPRSSAVRISGTMNGRAITPSSLLCGAQALPLLKSLDCRVDDEALSGWPAFRVRVPGARLMIGAVGEDTVRNEDLKNSPKQLKGMLEQWGYIN